MKKHMELSQEILGLLEQLLDICTQVSKQAKEAECLNKKIQLLAKQIQDALQ